MNFASSRQQRIRWTVVLIVLVLLIAALRSNAAQKRKSHPVRKSVPHHRVRHSSRSRHSRRRYTQVKIQPDRVMQIQQALIDAGELHQAPNGRWDEATRDAMRQYQQNNGFSPTGLPEAKPLMRLGLGPHPLPPGLGPKASTQAQAETRTDAVTSPDPPSPGEEKSASSSSNP